MTKRPRAPQGGLYRKRLPDDHFADLYDGRKVSVVWNVAEDLLCVGRESRFEGSYGFTENVTHEIVVIDPYDGNEKVAYGIAYPWSQPFLVPVRSRYSRSASNRVVQGRIDNARATPLTWRVTGCVGGNSAAGCFWGFPVELSTTP